MSDQKKILGLVGSPNKDGLTNRLVSRALEGAAKAGAATELVQMSDHLIETCHDCLPWVCRQNMKCTYEDPGFEFLSNAILNCKGLIIGTPVYWGDTSAQVRLLMIKMVRVCLSQIQNKHAMNLPAFGIAVAGGSGNGLLSALHPLYHFFRFLRFRAIEPLPVTKFNLKQSEITAEESGYKIAKMAEQHKPFENRNECQLWHDSLPYHGEDLTAERRLLAAIISEAVPEGNREEIKGNLARADILAAAGNTLESITEISAIIDSGTEIINRNSSAG